MFSLLSSDTNEEIIPKLEDWQVAKEIIPSENFLSAASFLSNVGKIELHEITVQHLERKVALNSIAQDEECDLSIHEAEENHSDIITSKYEGGLKIWECTHDLAKWIQLKEKLFNKTVVLDLGCGGGMVGILAMYMSAASVHFQDYNADVIKHWTIPNVALNFGNVEGSFYWSGDWDSFADKCKTEFDVILSSETLYNSVNYTKLYKILLSNLKKTGIAYFASKAYYFGVGGSCKQFASIVQKENKFTCITVWKSSLGVQREILEIKWNNQ